MKLKMNSASVAAKMLKIRLRDLFPNARFSVKTMLGADSSCIMVQWSGDADIDVVKAMADEYKLGDFDGTDDSYTYRNPKKYGAKYIQVREIRAEF